MASVLDLYDLAGLTCQNYMADKYGWTDSLTYFADGVLADECGEIVDDVEEIIGDGLDHFGEYEDDSVFVRSDAKRCDYEILKDLRDFSDFKKKNFPPNNDEEV